MGNIITFKTEFGLIVVGSIIFTASFLWRDLLLDIENHLFPMARNNYGILWRIIYTVIISLILVLVAIHLKNIFGLIQTRSLDDDDDNDLINNSSQTCYLLKLLSF